MNNELFNQIKELSLELRSLIRQGIREGVDERITKRNELLQEWFAGVTELIQMTNEQQNFLESLLSEEQALVNELRDEQQGLAAEHNNSRKVREYLKH